MPARPLTPPSGEPVTLAAAKSHLRLETALDDDYVNVLIAAARSYVEEACWRVMLAQTWELVLPGFLGEDRFELGERDRRGFSWPVVSSSTSRFLPYIELPRGQTDSLASDAVKYIDANGVQQTLAASVYTLDNVNVPARVRLAYDQAWPMTRDQWDAVRIQYVVGWASAAAVPAPLIQAMLILIAAMYEFRTPEVEAVLAKVGFSVDALMQPYRLVRL